MKKTLNYFACLVLGIFIIVAILDIVSSIKAIEAYKSTAGFPESMVTFSNNLCAAATLRLIVDCLIIVVAPIGIVHFYSDSERKSRTFSWVTFFYGIYNVGNILIIDHAYKSYYPTYHMAGYTVAILIIAAIFTLSSMVAIAASAGDRHKMAFGLSAFNVFLFTVVAVINVVNIELTTLYIATGLIISLLVGVFALGTCIFETLVPEEEPIVKRDIWAEERDAEIEQKEAYDEKLIKLKSIYDKGAITKKEYDEKRAEILKDF